MILKTARNILLEYWGYTSFRQGQEKAISSILSNKDTMVLLPTGGGKSLCFQIPALIKPGICLVISPLIALMEDQVIALNKKGIKAMHLAGNMSLPELERRLNNVLYGNFKFLYLSPERLQNEVIQQTILSLEISLIAIDEAHCISQWGNDFRPSYRKITLLRTLIKDTPFIALTATATSEVIKDIVSLLEMEKPTLVQTSFSRPNLSYETYSISDKFKNIEHILTTEPGSAILYVRNRRATLEYSKFLNKLNIKSTYFHGGLSTEDKNSRLQSWLNEETPVMVATNAFGMGIDKPNVRHVIHLQIPESLESYFQEAGRAGRDGKSARSILLYNNYDPEQTINQYTRNLASLDFLKSIYRKLNTFFQISYGEGDFTSHDFSFSEFCTRYDLPLTKTHNALKTLNRIGVLELEQIYGRKCILQFIVSNQTLLNYFMRNQEIEHIGQNILRMYGGIFEVPTRISVEAVAKRTQKSVNAVLTAIKKMGLENIIKLELYESDVQIQFLVPREDDRTLNRMGKEIDQLNKNILKKIQQCIRFVENNSICKSRQLLAYFGEKKSDNCGICSVCLKMYNQVNKVQKQDIKIQILDLLKENIALEATEISNRLHLPLTDTIEVLRNMLELKKIKLHFNTYQINDK